MPPKCAPFWTGLSILGNGWGILAVTAPLLVFAPRYQWAWLCAAPFAILFARSGKFLIESPRPAAVVDPSQMRVVGELLHNVSMPSGHTLTAFAVAADTLEDIRAIISDAATGAIEAHDVRTRHAGPRTFIDFHLVVDGQTTVDAAHEICDRIEQALKKALPDAQVTIHVEPEHKAKHSGVVVI